MEPNLLILGGTTEATALCRALHEAGTRATVSLAGRVERPIRQPLPLRVGGFGGAEGLAAYLTAHKITHVIDATHPFAAQMSRNAVEACTLTNTPLIALTRAPWTPEAGDDWTRVPDIAGAVKALDRAPERVMLAVGRMHLPEFAPNPQHFYLLRLVDAPDTPPDFPDHFVQVDRGPFSYDGDLALMRAHKITMVVSKNSGGTGAQAKLLAARTLGLPVVMIDRPALPARAEAHSVAEVLGWLDHTPTDLGV
ncbi:cobalt-precorrin-6A reductase [Tropicibacter naphthalenivorans]|uniref:Precorrin-6A reductase n=1 Tax=Tropicibacter naphthalenivorans TaxID=441103 RepID=A0A0P1GGB1_9RHOB|nr:cobalt-precorrin-6A reductase [Tropicibacter naphthalenivorans]CUH80823.1 Precorrin-6A reductase [Tropicibacter naphthalenivorans]SMC90406.1 precorrin-6A reductase [Tropicibacter naphthalenivorans]